MWQESERDRGARAAMSRYPADLARAFWVPLGNADGFSGARLWRATAADGCTYGLRAWPVGKTTPERVAKIHQAFASCKLPFVPELVPTTSGDTWVEAGGRIWEVQTWLPGAADFHARPTDARLFNAVRALARIHDTWEPEEPKLTPAPAVGRILTALRNWRSLVADGWKPNFRYPFTAEIHQRGRRAWDVLHESVIGLEFALLEWEARPLPVQTCLCDVWYAHVLYEGDAVTGVVDFGAVKEDCVAIDLARMLGSLIPDESARMNLALAVYSAVRPVPQDVIRLVPVLDQVGSVVGLSNWLRWLYHEKRMYPDPAQVVKRMDALLKRVEKRRQAALMGFALDPFTR
jgi:hypothetical protein